MAKELFNSPRYKEKGFISKILDGSSLGCLLCVLLLIFCIIIDVFFLKNAVFCILFLGLWPFCIIVEEHDNKTRTKIKYFFYVRTLKKQKNLFHIGKKSPYIAPYELLDHNFTNLKLRLFAVVMMADKEEKVVELEKVKAYISNHELAKRLNELKKYLKEDFAVEDVAFAMYWWYEKDREEIMKALFDLAYADGDFCEEEEYTLRYIAYHMHLNESEYERALRNFIKEKNKNKKDGYGYWYHDKKGNRRWYSFKNEEKDKKTEGNSNNSGYQGKTTPSISPELQKAYAVLGIPVDATPSEINACKRNLLRLNHPDLVATKGQEAVNNATLKCQRINQAYELLKANGKC